MIRVREKLLKVIRENCNNLNNNNISLFIPNITSDSLLRILNEIKNEIDINLKFKTKARDKGVYLTISKTLPIDILNLWIDKFNNE